VLARVAIAWPTVLVLAIGSGCAASSRPAAGIACRVAVDVGHDREHPGATSARGAPERTFNEALARTVVDALRAVGIDAFLVAASGDPIPPAARADLALAGGATLLVSIHHDSVQPQYLSSWVGSRGGLVAGDRFRGFGLFVARTSPAFDASVAAAATIADALLASGLSPSLHHAEPIPGENRELLDRRRGIYVFDELAILRHARIPAVLLEAAVIANPQDELDAASAGRQRAVASAIVAAAARQCGGLGADRERRAP
jgi:N-acetylmuramoyl-L-alanine amidase